MNFHSVISLASNNKQSATQGGFVKRYSTEVPAPKKPPKSSVQPDAVKAFLAKKQREEEMKARHAEKKKQDLLELRAIARNNKKANAMAKRTKDNNFMENFTVPGSSPPYSNNYASRDLYHAQHDRGAPHPSNGHIRSTSDSHTVDRSKSAVKTIPSRDKHPLTNRSTDQSSSSGNRSEAHGKRPTTATSSGPTNFYDLLKLAAEKQHEPVELPRIPKKRSQQDDITVQGRPMTSEEKRRFIEEQARKQGRSVETVSLPNNKRKRFRGQEVGDAVSSQLLSQPAAPAAPSRSAGASRPTSGMGTSIDKRGPSRGQCPGRCVAGSLGSKSSDALAARHSNLTTSVRHSYEQPSVSNGDRSSRVAATSSRDQSANYIPQKKCGQLYNESQRRPVGNQERSREVREFDHHKRAPPRKESEVDKASLTSAMVTCSTGRNHRADMSSSVPSKRMKPSSSGTDDIVMQKREKGLSGRTAGLSYGRSAHINGLSASSSGATSSVSSKSTASGFKAPSKGPQMTEIGSGRRGAEPVRSQSNSLSRSKAVMASASRSPIGNGAIASQRAGNDLRAVRKPAALPQAREQRREDVHARFDRAGPPPVRNPPPRCRQFPPKDVLPPLRPAAKRRRIESDDEEEFDEEMDDFIDDGPVEDVDDFNYSDHIREIFGYDKNRYRFEADDDILESSFSRQMQEEAISTKLGMLEDMEDMRKEEEELMRKLAKRKKQLKRK